MIRTSQPGKPTGVSATTQWHQSQTADTSALALQSPPLRNVGIVIVISCWLPSILVYLACESAAATAVSSPTHFSQSTLDCLDPAA